MEYMGLVFDIETAPDLEDKTYVSYKSAGMGDKRKRGENLEQDVKDKINDEFALSPLTGKITAIGFMSEHKPDNLSMEIMPELDSVGKVYYRILTLEEMPEAELITSAWRVIDEYMGDGHRLITYNGIDFDIPFMVRRSILWGVSKPPHLPTIKDIANKYSSRYHLDLFQELHTYNELKRYKFISQQEWAYRMGLVTDLKGSHGAECISMYQVGDWSGIRAHLLADLSMTMMLSNRAKGWMNAYELE